jgi:hypothetical protein
MDNSNNQEKSAAVLPRLAVAIDDAPEVTGAKRTRIFEAVRNKEITVRKAGRSTLVEVAELQRWIKSLPTKGRQPDEATADANDRAALASARAKVRSKVDEPEAAA